MTDRTARYSIGQVVKHKHYPFRGVVFDVDPEFSNSEQWWESIPEDIRPSKDQPFYHLLAEMLKTAMWPMFPNKTLSQMTTLNPLIIHRLMSYLKAVKMVVIANAI